MKFPIIFGDTSEDTRQFHRLPRCLNGHRLFYKGDAPSVKETKEEQAFAEVSGKKWQYYQETFRPLEDAFMEDVNELNTDAARGFASGAAASSTTAAFDDARKATSENLTNSGVNPASGKYQATMVGLADAEGYSSSENKAMAKNSVDDSYVGGLSNISAIGRGQSTSTQAGLSDFASSASNKAARDAEREFNSQAANLDAAGSLAGAGAYAFKKYRSNEA